LADLVRKAKPLGIVVPNFSSCSPATKPRYGRRKPMW
jgi:hypothetical protein